MTRANNSAATPATAAPKRDHHGSVKETLESILVAFILAFIFRAFVVEAFVIPTGSMAPTLLGAHMRFTCKDCGYDFTTNYQARQTPSGELIIGSVSHQAEHRVNCPNCGFTVPRIDPQDPDNDATYPPVYYGDRILVLKYLYLFEDPQRWDVVVFKNPDRDPGAPLDATPTYTQNYIKRLVGRPGESVMILDGDIYVGGAGENIESYAIQPKPRYAQSALWRVIYDNDFRPQHLPRRDGQSWKQPWTVRDGSGWDLGKAPADGRIFRFNNASGGSTISFDRQANEGNYAFTDFLAYDMNGPAAAMHDLRVAFFYERQSGAGPLRVSLSDGRQKFVGIITPTEAKLVRADGDKEELLAPAVALPTPDGRPLRVEMTNVDYEVSLLINDRVVARTTAQQYRPDILALRKDYRSSKWQPWPGVEISAAEQSASISHLGLWRDIYYGNANARFGNPDKPINLGPQEYFVLGDNSPLSGDARYWDLPINLKADQLVVEAGRVPGRFLLGRAFFVYWPAGFRPHPWMPALAPDFGDMRYIR